MVKSPRFTQRTTFYSACFIDDFRHVLVWEYYCSNISVCACFIICVCVIRSVCACSDLCVRNQICVCVKKIYMSVFRFASEDKSANACKDL